MPVCCLFVCGRAPCAVLTAVFVVFVCVLVHVCSICVLRGASMCAVFVCCDAVVLFVVSCFVWFCAVPSVCLHVHAYAHDRCSSCVVSCSQLCVLVPPAHFHVDCLACLPMPF